MTDLFAHRLSPTTRFGRFGAQAGNTTTTSSHHKGGRACPAHHGSSHALR